MLERNAGRMQQLPRNRPIRHAVLLIADDRETGLGEVAAHLMFATGLKTDVQQASMC